MKIIKNWSEFILESNKLAQSKKRKFLYISSFNLASDNANKSILTNMCPDKILVGVGYKECKVGCKECLTTNRLKQLNLLDFQANNPDIDIKITNDLHLKMVITNEGVITGGINFTGSNWTDVAILIEDSKTIKEMKKHFEEAWDNHDNYNYSNNAKSYVISFGKYKGIRFEEVKSSNPEYIEWCKNNMDWFKKDLEILGVK